MIHKTTRSILSVLLAALLLVTSVPLTPAFAGGGAVSLQSESGEGEGLTGDGTKDNPYKIATANDLREFAQRVNNGQIRADADAVLTDDIDLNNQPWYPIGTSSSNPYSGTFDGANYTISGLYIDSSNADYQGLFGCLDQGGTVQNLSVSGTVSGNNYVGGVVGLNGGSVEDCDFTGSVSGNYVGGVVGNNSFNATVTNCYNTGNVSGETTGNVGGVVGYNSFSVTVTNCYNTGKVSGSGSGSNVGGVVGYNDSGTVENSYNTGKVSGPDSGTSNYVGGVVGYNISSVANCFFLTGTAGSGIGNGSGGAAVVDDLPELCKKFENDPWSISPFYKHPVLKTNPEGGDGTKEHPYEIKTAAQLENFRDIVNDENGQVKDSDAHAKLMNNIDLSSVCGESLNGGTSWNPIGTSSSRYSGTFDGDGHTISGLYIDSSSDNYQGLFGYLGTSGDNKGTVQNLSVSGTVNSSGDYVGGVVGYNNGGTVTGCIFSGSGSVSGDLHVGGVVG